MTSIRIISTLLITTAALGLRADTQAPSLQQYFHALARDPSVHPKKYDDLLKIMDEIPGAAPGDISKAMPDILAALARPDISVKRDAGFALVMISYRPDSAALLKDYLNPVSTMFDIPVTELQGLPTTIYMNLQPSPPPQVVPILLEYLKRKDRDTAAQSSAIFSLVHIAPQNPKVIAAIREFLSRPLDSGTRIGVLNALGDPVVKDPALVAMVIASLDDSDPGVRFTAAQSLGGMGAGAVQQAEPALQRLAADPKQPPDVTKMAKDALQQLHPPKSRP